jgi:N-alpha-acetyl-L-2,4-diaminobutyrate deacetylase
VSNFDKLRPSPVSPTVDLDADGVQHGHLKLPYSHDESAWGALMIPIAVIANGKGPTALFTGGNHGDEYEGPIALHKLARELKPDEVTGRVIILPGLNHPAQMAGRRTSPIDGGNMNRAFPGKPDGTMTEKIADYVTRHLLPMADLVADIHSGGRTLEFVPFAACHLLSDKAQEARCIAAMEAFGAPYAMTMLELDAVGMIDTAAEELGKTFVTTELAGGGTTRPETVAIAERGLRNLLIHQGILKGEPERAPSVRLDMPDGDCFVACEHEGLVEPCVGLGQPVGKGDVIARVHDLKRTGVAAAEYRAKRGGLLAGRHFPGRIAMGDCLGVVAEVVEA